MEGRREDLPEAVICPEQVFSLQDPVPGLLIEKRWLHIVP
jgi:hypothetical protein